MLTFDVQDMTCNHCAGAITRAVKEIDANARVDVRIAEKRVTIDSGVAAAKFAEAIREAGYTPVAIEQLVEYGCWYLNLSLSSAGSEGLLRHKDKGMNQERKAWRIRITAPERRGFFARTAIGAAGALALLLAGCGHMVAQDAAYTIDTSIQSPNQNSRVRTLVLHYTAETLADSIASLTDPQKSVSSHYLVPDAADGSGRFHVYALVPESRRAWHAGVSYWQGERMLNASTVGIEVVNLGFSAQDGNAPQMDRRWYPYPDAQIAVVARLAADVIGRHEILPQKVVGHSDIAPGRKSDPGPLFPWRTLYTQYGIGAWPEAEAVSYYRSRQPFRGDIGALQEKLLAYGYDTPQTGVLDARTSDVIAAFQMHFRPEKYDGAPDVETVAILDALLEKYFRRSRTP